MSKKHDSDKHGFVYSTNPDFNFEKGTNEAIETPGPAQQKLRIRFETKHRGGKAVSIVQGFIGKEEDLEQLSKSLKNFCGTGGAVKDGEVIIQGDQREKMLQWLLKSGYKASKKM